MASSDRSMLCRLRELIAALDRRQPHRDDAEERRIARDSASLKRRAEGQIAELEASQSDT